ncbi:histidine phosphatase superfamily [Tricladium varicosporioides]|nr:histidine phosphatase superfamily [Hymenoscyphus varicosporioides]
MAPTVILIRHAQALHSQYLGYGPQCAELAKFLQNELPIAQQIELIVVSPMRRTLQTAQQGLGWLMERGVPVVLRPEWQENSAKPCDTGTEISEMQKEWPQFNWSTVDPKYPSKTGLYEFSKTSLSKRGIEARKWLRNRPEKVIAVVSHSGFLRVGVSYKKYENADFRIFDFAEGDEEIGGKLVEWELTEKKGGGLGKSPRGTFPFGPGDYPEESKDVGEAVDEQPK